MEPDDLQCSRNVRSRTPLVGRAQWKIIQPPSLRGNEEHSDRFGRSIRARRIIWHPPQDDGDEEKKGGLAIPCARATRGLRRPSLDARTMEPAWPPFILSVLQVETQEKWIRAIAESVKISTSFVHKTCKYLGPQILEIPACKNEPLCVLKSDGPWTFPIDSANDLYVN